MQQKKTSIFPTDIWIFDNVLEDYQKKNINEAVYNESNRNKLSNQTMIYIKNLFTGLWLIEL